MTFEESFAKTFPSLKTKELSVPEVLAQDYFVDKKEIIALCREDFVECCVDKQRLREAIEKELDNSHCLNCNEKTIINVIEELGL